MAPFPDHNVKRLVENKFSNLPQPVQCFAGYFDIEYGHLLDGEKQMGVISSEGALYVILPNDYPQPLFEHTPVLNDNFEH